MENKNRVSIVSEDGGSVSRTMVEGRMLLLTIPGGVSGTVVNNYDEDLKPLPGATTYIQIVVQPDEFDSLPLERRIESGFEMKTIEIGEDESGRSVIINFARNTPLSASDKKEWEDQIRKMLFGDESASE